MVTFLRDTSKDILSVLTLYTLTSTVEVGTHLYDAEGNDTGLIVGTVNQDGSWSLASLIPISFYMYPEGVNSYTIDGITYTTSSTVDLAEGSHSLVIDATKNHVYICDEPTYNQDNVTFTLTISGTSITITDPNNYCNITCTTSDMIKMDSQREPI